MKRADAGIADEHIDAAESIDGGLDEGRRAVRIGDILLERNGPAAKPFHHGHGFICLIVSGIKIIERNIGALPRCTDGCGAADAGGGTRNQNDLILQQHMSPQFHPRRLR